MSTLDVVAEILREVAPRALKAREIASLAGNRLPTASRTPETVVSRDLAIDVRDHGTTSRFLRVDRGAFVLKEALPIAFYNELDGYAAAWVRNLSAAGEIAAGIIDERSIRDIKPADVASYRQCHFFAGIGVWSRALRDAGWSDDSNVWSGSCPCTPWSSAGRKRGVSDEQHLWPEWFRLIEACRPSWIFGEQVSSKDGLVWLDLVRTQLEGANYALRVLDTPACSVGAPHRRQRLYFVAYARERGREILSAPWLHDRRQPGYYAARCSETHSRAPSAVSDAAVTRPHVSQDDRSDRGDEGTCAETIDWRAAGNLEPERGRDADEACAVSDAECVVRDKGRQCGSHGRPQIESDRHGEADGAEGMLDADCVGREGSAAVHDEAWDGQTSFGSSNDCGCGGSIGMGDASLARSGRDGGAVPRTQEAREGERIEAGDFFDESVAPGAANGGVVESGHGEDVDVEVVRGAVSDSRDRSDGSNNDESERSFGFRPGDRIRLDGDPSWGGAVGGFWADNVEWIYCRPEPGHQDGRWRPAQSGTSALVNGSTSSLGRTRSKRLKAYGNAIVLPAAVAFVASVLDALADDARIAHEGVTLVYDAVDASGDDAA